MSVPKQETVDNNLRVLFDFEYKTKDDRKISIKEGEKLFLIKKTNPDWWQVIRSSKERPFYVPATYVEEPTIGNGNINQVKSNAQSAEHKLRNKLDRESNGNLLAKYPGQDNYYRQQTKTSQENAHSGKLDGKYQESIPFFIKHTEESPEAKRILFDKRKSWAVEELMLELTQKRDGKTGPEPEPEPDYANIYRDEHGIHIVDNTGSSLVTSRPLPNTKPSKNTVPSGVNGNSTAASTTVKKSVTSDINKKDKGNQFLISKQGLSGVEEGDNGVCLQNVTATSHVASRDIVLGLSNAPTCSLSVKENGGFLLTQDFLRGSSKDLKNFVKPAPANLRSSFKVNNDESRISVVSVDGSDGGKVSGQLQSGGYSTVAVTQDSDTESRYSKVSIVRKDSSRSSINDLSNDDSQVFSRDGDITASQRLTKGPKIKQLSESLEKLAQQIQFGPAVSSEPSPPSWRKKQSRSFEEESQSVKRTQSLEEKDATDFDLNNLKHNIYLNTDEKLQTYPNKMLKKVKNKFGLQYSSSFKTKKELEMNKKVHQLETEDLDHRVSVSGNVSIDPSSSSVVFRSGKDKEGDIAAEEITSKESVAAATFHEIHQKLQNISEQPRDSTHGLPLNSFGKTAHVSSPNHRSPKDNLAIIGEATILRDDTGTRFPFETNAEPKNLPSQENLSKIALGFQNPSYRSISHSLDSFHDPRVVHAMHDALCTDLDQQQKLKREKKSTESLQGSSSIAEKSSKWKVARQIHENQGVGDSKIRNFQKLRNSIEENEFGLGRETGLSVLSGKQVKVTSDSKDVLRKENVSVPAIVSSHSELSKVKIGSVEDVKVIDRAFEGIYDGLGELKTSRSSSKASLDGDKVLKDHSSKSSLDELVSSFENRSLSKSNLSLNQRKPSNGSEGNRSRSDSNTSDDTILQAPESRRRTSLSRGTRVESIKERHQLKLPARPPSPPPAQQPVKALHDGWGEYLTQDGRTYYYSHAGGKSWKPPRKNKLSVSRDTEDGITSSKLGPEFKLPPGWRESFEDGCDSELRCFVHQSGARWFSSNNDEQKIYFFEENSNESSWTLPDIPVTPDADAKPVDLLAVGAKPKAVAKLAWQMGADQEEAILRGHRVNQPFRLTKAMSMVMVPTKPDDKSPTSVPLNWPHLFDGKMKFLREGPLHRTKITELGKKVRKNWCSSYVVLSEPLLLFFHDIKHAQALKNGEQLNLHPPEISIDLSGAHIERGDKLSRRKNVFVISAQLGFQVLIQSDSSKTAEEWFHSVQTQIALLPGKCDSIPRINASPEETKKSSKLGRSRSVKLKRAEGSMEDLTATPEERQTKIRARLKKFFVRRPTKDALVKKGIYKDEPMFGRSLGDVVGPDAKGVPIFVTRCIAAIESKEENMKADGLYRVSGNLSQVQKIRLQADQNNLASLEEEEDVHVLTGALKLFFRELKQPLIPTDLFAKALKASSNPDKKEKTRQFRDIVKALPMSNRETLKYILLHLLRVAEHKDSNRMHLANLAIVFGPTLMWPEEESLNMAIDLMQQNLVIESLLIDYHTIFR